MNNRQTALANLKIVLVIFGTITAACTGYWAAGKIPVPMPFSILLGIAFGIGTAITYGLLEGFDRETGGSPSARFTMFLIMLTTVFGATDLLEQRVESSMKESEIIASIDRQIETLQANDELHVQKGWGINPNHGGNPEIAELQARRQNLLTVGVGSANALYRKIADQTGVPFWLVTLTFSVLFAFILDWLYVNSYRLLAHYKGREKLASPLPYPTLPDTPRKFDSRRGNAAKRNKRAARIAALQKYVESHPEATRPEMARHLNVSVSTVDNYMREINKPQRIGF